MKMKNDIIGAAAAFMVLAAGANCFAATDWTGAGADTLTSTQENWDPERTDDTVPMRFAGQGGKTATFDKAYSISSDGGYVWIGGEGADWSYTYPDNEAEAADGAVVFEAKDADAAYGFAATGDLKIADGQNPRGALLIKSGTYSTAGDIIVGGTGSDGEDATGYLAMVGGALSCRSAIIGQEGKGTLMMGGYNPENHPVLTTAGITGGSGEALFEFNWGTLVPSEANPEFLGKNVAWTIGGNPTIMTGVPIAFPNAPGGAGNIAVSVTNIGGCVVMPISPAVLLNASQGTHKTEAGGYASFYSSDTVAWTVSTNFPAANTDVVVPAGVTIVCEPISNIMFKSLRVDGTLIVSGDYPILTAANKLEVAGTGSFGLAKTAKELYQDISVNVDSSITFLAYRTFSEIQGIESEEYLFKVAGSSKIIDSQVKIPSSRRSVASEVVEESVSGSLKARRIFHWCELPPDWTSIITRKGQIVWDAPVTLSDDNDISQEGTFVHGFFHSYPAKGHPYYGKNSLTVKGVTLACYFGSNQSSPYLTYTSASGTAFNLGNSRIGGTQAGGTDATCLDESASALYSFVTVGGIRCNNGSSGGAMDITIGDLIDGHAYLVQIFCMDESLRGDAVATMYVGDTNSTSIVSGDVAVKLNVNAASGDGPGQYVIGRFVADGDSQTIRIKSSGSSVARENMILWREITKDVYWGGGTNTWNFSGQNWMDYSADNSIWTNNVVGFAHSAVATDSASITVSGRVYANSLKLSDDAKVTVPSGSALTIASDIVATTNAAFSAAGSLTLGGSLSMTGYGEFSVDSSAVSDVSVERGNIVRTSSTTPTRLTFSSTALYGDETAKSKGYHALYSATGDITLSSISGSGNITADNNGILTINNADDSVYAGHLRAKSFTKSGKGTLKIIGESDFDTSFNITEGTLALAVPSDIDGFAYDYDASATDTLEIDGTETVTKWSPSALSGTTQRFLTPKGYDDLLVTPATYENPVLTSGDESIFGGRPALVSNSFRMDANTTEDQQTLFAVMQFTGNSISAPRILTDANDTGSTKPKDRYRLRIQVKDGHPAYYDIMAHEVPENAEWISVNGEYGTNATIAAGSPMVMCVPWHWMRSDKGYGARTPAYGWGAPMAWGEIVSYTRALAVEEKNAVEEYLMRKWGIGDGDYRPFGTADVVVGKDGTLDAAGQELAIRSLTVSGTLKSVAGVTVDGDVTFNSGAKIYLDESDAVSGIITVNGNLSGQNNVTFYVKRPNGKYERTRSYSMKKDPATNKLVFTKTGFTIHVQ